MITAEEAAALCEVSTRDVYRWLETGAVHFSEKSGEELLICLNSLAATATKGPQIERKADGRAARDSY